MEFLSFKVFFCQTQEDIDGIVSSLGDWIADCGVPGIYNAAPKDMRRIYGQVIKHHIYFRYKTPNNLPCNQSAVIIMFFLVPLTNIGTLGKYK